MKYDFYIGYLPKAPKNVVRFAIILVVLLFLLGGATAYFLSFSHRSINNGVYEYGELTEITGKLHLDPIPYIRIKEGAIGKNILLIDFGKFGARASVSKIKEAVGGNLNNVDVTIRGTLVYHDGFTLMELTESENALVSFQPSQSEMFIRPLINKTLKGEIVDSKCYFGSMKPGQSKPHRSCATLCIAGGIPAVLVVPTPQNTAEYYILKGEDGRDINSEILDKVAQSVTITGKSSKLNEWNILYLEPENIKQD